MFLPRWRGKRRQDELFLISRSSTDELAGREADLRPGPIAPFDTIVTTLPSGPDRRANGPRRSACERSPDDLKKASRVAVRKTCGDDANRWRPSLIARRAIHA